MELSDDEKKIIEDLRAGLVVMRPSVAVNKETCGHPNMRTAVGTSSPYDGWFESYCPDCGWSVRTNAPAVANCLERK